MRTKLGQNFLKNKEIVKKIVQSADVTQDDFVLEIGPGKGILTEELAKYAGKVVAIEIDSDLAKRLDSRFCENDRIEIVNEDILKLDLKNIFCHSEREAKFIEQRSEAREGREAKSGDLNKQDSSTSLGMTTCKYKLIANLPYYITSPIIRLFLESENPPKEMILMIQKEVAERIVASPSEIPIANRDAKHISRGKPGRMSILAVSVQYYAEPKILFYVGKENFDPIPEVDSAVIRITHAQKHRSNSEIKKFFRVVRAGFSAKRKTLVNNLASNFHLEKDEIEKVLTGIGIKKSSRAQELSIIEWEKITKFLLAKSQK